MVASCRRLLFHGIVTQQSGLICRSVERNHAGLPISETMVWECHAVSAHGAFALQKVQHRHFEPDRFLDRMHDVVKNPIERLIAAEGLADLGQVRQLLGAAAQQFAAFSVLFQALGVADGDGRLRG
jgi:hypothetical protein